MTRGWRRKSDAFLWLWRAGSILSLFLTDLSQQGEAGVRSVGLAAAAGVRPRSRRGWILFSPESGGRAPVLDAGKADRRSKNPSDRLLGYGAVAAEVRSLVTIFPGKIELWRATRSDQVCETDVL
jgi:hypothetical protein